MKDSRCLGDAEEPWHAPPRKGLNHRRRSPRQHVLGLGELCGQVALRKGGENHRRRRCGRHSRGWRGDRPLAMPEQVLGLW